MAGPTATTKKDGKIKSARGNISLVEIFAAFSSALWRRAVRKLSEYIFKAWATLVPNR